MVSTDVQRAVAQEQTPSDQQIERWIEAALATVQTDRAALTIRFVGESEMSSLNQQFRGRLGPTNVLSLPFEAPEGLPEVEHEMGDIVVCAPLVASEANDQGKTQAAHCAHLIVHGVLHLQGYDHTDERTAQEMESLEIKILAGLGITNPYLLETA